MKHIFYVHSNICMLAVYGRIKELVETGDQVLLLLGRNIEPIYDIDNVIILNVSFLSNTCPKIKGIRSYISYRKYKHRVNVLINKIIQDCEYYAYIPIFSNHFLSSLCLSSKCKGYYYIEEGSLAYKSSKYLEQYYSTFNMIVSKLLRVNYYKYLHINKRFMGTIAINSLAFSWNINKEKYYYSIKDVVLNNKAIDFTNQKNIVVLGPLKDNVDNIKQDLICLFNFFHERNINSAAIKFHPQSKYIENSEMKEIIRTLKNVDIKFEILPDTFILESSIVKFNPTIFVIEIFSSVGLYAIINNSFCYYINSNNKRIQKIENMNSIFN